MGEIVAAAICAHVPTIMLPEAARRRMGDGEDTTLVEGLVRLRRELDRARPDTLAIVDTHWFTLTEHVVAGAAHFRGVYTSPELPRAIRDHAYDFPGAPELARLVHQVGRERGIPTTNALEDSLPREYPTLNLVHHLRAAEGILSMGVCQAADAEDFLALGDLLGEAIRRSDARVALLGSGALSHRFWPFRELRAHLGFSPEHVVSVEARAIDERIVALWRRGDHAAVIDLQPEFQAFAPEGRFAHYLIVAGALGGRAWQAPGRPLSAYESSLGTGEIHVWFDLGSSTEGEISAGGEASR
ncbi:MAG: catechol 1,2-dioxygenase [Myxococcota bacterium]